MITITLITLGFLGGLYVGARYAEWLREIFHAITGK